MITPEPIAPAYHFLSPDRLDDPREAYRAWQAHIDAGRIGANPPPDPAIVANTARTASLFRAYCRAGAVR